MRNLTFTLFATCILLAANAAPLGERGSVEYRIRSERDNHPQTAVEATPPPRASSAGEMRVAQPTPPPWKRETSKSTTPTQTATADGSLHTADAPDMPASLALGHAAKATSPQWKRGSESESESAAPHHDARTDTQSSPKKADAPGWKRRATDSATDPSLSLLLRVA
ncbi:hypothetical protein K438DRAFT_1782008 [Mycena galopus ATCC 62051]|nr:hypothetical protein K438DRAFT_1782008 [Mycena galopus ATCC 62051]